MSERWQDQKVVKVDGHWVVEGYTLISTMTFQQ